uniref:Kinesin-13A-like isoform X2 n=1 Tax=Nicotiana tabacum TaxID=4097 RepID=A0A1S4BK15_TOBAC|nr:PREDICTED: kinesin-13A-like isoform X2 [Nicotiana tabacum]
MQQSNGAATAGLYDQQQGNASPAADAGDAVMARWLQSAGLQHLASPMAASTGVDHRLLIMQGYGAQSMEEKQRLFKLMRNLNFNGESASEPYTPTAESSGGIGASDGFYSPEFRGDFGAGLLDLHSMDDTELLSEHVNSEPFEPSPFMPAANGAFDSNFDAPTHRQQKAQPEADIADGLPIIEKESNARENNVAKIKVVVYRATVEPIIPTIFQRTKATCFAYGQTGSGKTYTMQPLPLRAADDLVRLLYQPIYRNQKFKLWLSFFEIYGGKLFDLLSDRKLVSLPALKISLSFECQ